MQSQTCLGTELAPMVRFDGLRHVWFQVAGTLCNLRCSHCFISCAPDNHTFSFMTLEQCRRHLADAYELGAREFYFTGGEPFAHPDLCAILAEALRYGPSTVLTNAMLFSDKTLVRLAELRNAGHELTFRVSLDGYTPEMNDPIRGEGVFAKTLAGVAELIQLGYAPIITVTRTWCGCDQEILAGFKAALASVGYEHPRLKVLPSLKLGAEVQRSRGYTACERVTHQMMADYDHTQLICNHSRLITDRGVWVCPILLDAPEARMADNLADALRDYPLRHNACHTCWRHGAICSNTCTAQG